MVIAVEVLVVAIGVAVLVGLITGVLMRSNQSGDEKPKRNPAVRADMMTEIERLFSLYQSGALTDEEYQALKARLIEGQPVIVGDLQQRVERLLLDGNKINAIKLYREETSLGLKEAKDVVDDIERAMKLH